MTNCRHCNREIVIDEGRWVDPEATGDDLIWRETCEAHDTFVADHEPEGSAWAEAQEQRSLYKKLRRRWLH